MTAEPLDEIRLWHDIIATLPKPEYDRIAARDMSLFEHVPRREARPGDYSPLFGVPVIADATVPPNVLELRMGDKLVKRITIATPHGRTP